MVRELIRREFGVALSVVSVGRLLRKLGMSPQRPLHRAYQQDPEAVDRWKREEYPAIQAEAEAAGATVYFADEAGIRSDYHAGTTWSPVGQTPEVKNTGARYSVNMISVVSAKGALRFVQAWDGSSTATTVGPPGGLPDLQPAIHGLDPLGQPGQAAALFEAAPPVPSSLT